MACLENLKHGNPETQFKCGQHASEMGRKGAIARTKNQKKKTELLKDAQAVLDGNFTDKTGETHTGSEMCVLTLFKIATDPKHKQCIQAMRLLYELSGQMTPDKKKTIKLAEELKQAEIDLMKKRIENEEW